MLEVSAHTLEAALRARLAPSALEVIDESWQHAGHAGANGTGLGTHFRVRIAAPSLAGRARVAQHRMVYAAVQEFMTAGGVHALAIEVLPPACQATR